MSLFQEIEALKAQLDLCRPLTPGEAQRLREQFTIEYTYNSNAIEGNTLTLRETALVLEGVTIGEKPLKDHLEAVGHRDAFEYVTQLVSEKTPLSERVIKELHSLVLIDRPTDKGVYRRVKVCIMGALRRPPEPHEIPELMERLLKDHDLSALNPIAKAAAFHLRFEGIHPFIDGNGRTGRLIMNMILMQSGYPPIDLKFTDRRRYYDAFDSYDRSGDTGEMTLLIGEYVKARLKGYLQVLAPQE